MFILFIGSILSAPLQVAECKVTLDTSKIEYFECGFTEMENPEEFYEFTTESNPTPMSRAIGGITPIGKDIVIEDKGSADIRSNIYTIWAFKIGIKEAIIKLKGSPLKNGQNIIPYKVYIDKNDPLSILEPSLSVPNVKEEVEITNGEMADFIKFWKTKFVIRIPTIPVNAVVGDYSGSLTLEITTI